MQPRAPEGWAALGVRLPNWRCAAFNAACVSGCRRLVVACRIDLPMALLKERAQQPNEGPRSGWPVNEGQDCIIALASNGSV
jgi:hypothetical protein